MRVSRGSLLLRGVVAVVVVCCGLAVSAPAQTLTILTGFDGATGDTPLTSITQSTNGDFYGTTLYGGLGSGNVFEMSSSGKVTNVYNFCSHPTCTAEGRNIPSGLLLGSDGNFYGTASGGDGDLGGPGSIYKVTNGGDFITLHTFCILQPCPEGEHPFGLVQAGDENLYGTTSSGGLFGSGIIYRLSPEGEFTVLYNFCAQSGCTDGANPQLPPIVGSNGNLYGTTQNGGSQNHGAVYEITPSGDYSVLHSFCPLKDCTDGVNPTTLAQGANGEIYGATTYGGIGTGWGTVFKITPANQFTVLHSFLVTTDGEWPAYGPTLASDGNLYGTTSKGLGGFGGIYKITTSGDFSLLYSFCTDSGCVAGGGSPLVQGTDGLFYGTSIYGGFGDYGTVYSFDNNLGPLVETVPTMGKVGTRVIILGNNLTGSSSVMFNGVAAAFTVESDTYIRATVPVGATTGTVSVVTPSGTLNSNPQFVVTR